MDPIKEASTETLLVALTIAQIDALYKAATMANHEVGGDDDLEAAMEILDEAVNGGQS